MAEESNVFYANNPKKNKFCTSHTCEPQRRCPEIDPETIRLTVHFIHEWLMDDKLVLHSNESSFILPTVLYLPT